MKQNYFLKFSMILVFSLFYIVGFAKEPDSNQFNELSKITTSSSSLCYIKDLKLAIINPDIASKDVIKQSLDGFLIYEPKANETISNIISHISGITNGEKISELVIFSHGKAGSFKIGKNEINSKELLESTDFYYLFNLLASDGKIFSFSCDSGKGEEGENLLESLRKFTSADIYLSNNKTGKDGDWLFEVSSSNNNEIPSVDVKFLKSNYLFTLQQSQIPGYIVNNKAAMPTSMAGMAIDQNNGDIYMASASTGSTLYKVNSIGQVTIVSSNWSSAQGTFYPYADTDIEYLNGFVYSQLTNNLLRSVNTQTGAIESYTGATSDTEAGAAVIGGALFTTDGSTAENALYKWDLSSNTVINTGIVLPSSGYETIESTSNPNEIIYCGDGTFRKIDLVSNSISSVLASGIGGRSHFAVGPDGLIYYYTGSKIILINLSDGTQRDFIINIPNVFGINDLEFGPSSSDSGISLYFTNSTNLFEVIGNFNEAPVAVCKAFTAQLDASGNATISASDVDGGSNDTGGSVTLSIDKDTFDCSNIGAPVTVTLTVTDSAGKTDTCMATVTVTDNEAPTAIAQDIIGELDANGEVIITTAQINNGSTDNCDISSLSFEGEITAFAEVSEGQSLTITLPAGKVVTSVAFASYGTPTGSNGDYTQGTCHAADSQRIVEDYALGENSFTIPATNGKFGDPCFGTGKRLFVAVNYLPEATEKTFTCNEVGANTVNLFVTDANGNTSSATATVIVEDNMAPVFSNIGGDGTLDNPFTTLLTEVVGTVPSGTYYFSFNGSTFQGELDNDTDGGGWLMILNYVHQASDNPGLIVRNTDLPLLGTSTLGTSEAGSGTWGHFGNALAADMDFDEMRFYAQTSRDLGDLIDFTTDFPKVLSYVKTGVGDFTGINNPVNYTLGTNHTASIPQNAPNVWGNQGDLALTNFPFWRSGQAHWGIRGGGNRWEVDDFSINSTSTIHRVWVRGDLSPPASISSTEITVELDAMGSVSITPSNFDISAVDNCSTVTFSLSQIDFDCSHIGSNTIQYTATDDKGNAANIDVIVNVEDNVVPTITCVANAIRNTDLGLCQYTVDGIEFDATFTDNCMSGSITNNLNGTATIDGETLPKGDTTIEWTVNDGNGQTVTCTTVITVEDNQDPVISCVADTIRDTDPGLCQYTIIGTEFDATYTDNCMSGSITNNLNGTATIDGEILPKGDTTVIWTVNDGNGQSDTCTTVITVEDNEAPKALCLGGTTYLSSDFEGGIGVWITGNDATTICGQASISSTWNLATQTGGSAPETLGTTWYGMANNGEFGAERSWVESPTFSSTTSTMEINFDSYSSNESGYPRNYDVEHVQASINGGAYVDLHGNDPQLHNNADQTFRNITYSIPAAMGDTVQIRFLLDTCDNCCGDDNVIGWFVDNIVVSSPSGPIDVFLDSSGNATITVADIEGGSTDNCGISTTTISPSSFTCTDVGINIVTLTVTDINGNVSTCNSEINVLDIEAPVINCVADDTRDTDLGLCQYTVVGIEFDATFTDNCTSGSITNDLNGTATIAGEILLKGDTAIIWTANDGNGQTATCTTVITVGDNEDPIITCIADDTRDTDFGLCQYTVVGTEFDATFTDNCMDGSITNDLTGTSTIAGEILPKGNTTVVWTVVDGNGQTAACTTVITVEDNEEPIITCALNGTRDTDLGLCQYTVEGIEFDATFADNCSEGSITNDLNGTSSIVGEILPKGDTAVIWTVNDGNGQTATCTTVITVEDNEDPVITCTPNDFRDTDPGLCQYTVVGTEFDATFADNCSDGSITNDLNGTVTISGEILPKGDTSIIWTVNDGNGQTATCTTVITVRDNEDPLITCIADDTRDTDLGLCQYTVVGTEFDATFVDNCSDGSITNDLNGTVTIAGEILPKGDTSIIWTVNDGNGQSATCTTVITVEDNSAPVLIAEADQDVDLEEDCSIIIPDLVDGSTATDNCTYTITQVPVAGTVVPSEHNETVDVVVTVADAAGNIDETTVVLTSKDVSAPVLTAEAAQDVDLEADCSIIIPNLVDGSTATDNCTYAITQVPLAGTVVPSEHNGTVNVVVIATDAAGNIEEKTVVLTAKDVSAPVLTAEANQDVNLDDSCSIAVPDVMGTATDNCTVSNISQVPEVGSIISLEHNETVEVAVTATDAAGNIAEKTVVLTAKDVTAPNVDVPELDDITAVCEVLEVDVTIPTATDNCGGVVSVSHDAIFPIRAQGLTVITWSFEDVNGNIATQTQDVMIEDMTAPVPDVATLEDIVVECEAVNIVAPTATDNCGGSITGTTLDPLSYSEEGEFMILWEFNDGNGNSSSQEQWVTVKDNTAPQINTQDLTINVDQDEPAVITPEEVNDGSTDNCSEIVFTLDKDTFDKPGVYEVVLTGTDASGNTSQAPATIKVKRLGADPMEVHVVPTMLSRTSIAKVILPFRGRIMEVQVIEVETNKYKVFDGNKKNVMEIDIAPMKGTLLVKILDNEGNFHLTKLIAL